METPPKVLGPGAAVAFGTLVVNVPVIAIIIGVTAVAIRNGMNPLLSLLLGAAAGWIWWSLAVPHWRLWAYRRVASTSALQDWALTTGLVWPKGFFLERTEFKTQAHRRLEEQLERERP